MSYTYKGVGTWEGVRVEEVSGGFRYSPAAEQPGPAMN